MNIAFAIDINYKNLLINSINSILITCKNTNINFYVMCENNKTIEELNKDINTYFNAYNNFNFNLTLMKEEDKEFFIKYNRTKEETRGDIQPIHYGQLLLPVYYDIDRLLYLEADQIITKNLLDFYNTDFEENGLIVVPSNDIPRYTNNTLQYDKNNYKYFNAGVTLIDCKFYKEKNILEKAKKLIQENYENDYPLYEFYTQGVLNLLFIKYVKYVSYKYNLVLSDLDRGILYDNEKFNNYENENKNKIIENSYIIHYNGQRIYYNSDKYKFLIDLYKKYDIKNLLSNLNIHSYINKVYFKNNYLYSHSNNDYQGGKIMQKYKKKNIIKIKKKNHIYEFEILNIVNKDNIKKIKLELNILNKDLSNINSDNYNWIIISGYMGQTIDCFKKQMIY